MREKLKSLPLTELKQIAKENHIKNVSTLRKAVQVNLQAAERCQLPSRSTVRLKSLAHFMQSSILRIIRLLQIHMQIWII